LYSKTLPLVLYADRVGCTLSGTREVKGILVQKY
jgi:hypothetical protein